MNLASVWLRKGAQQFGLDLKREDLERFHSYWLALIEWNQKGNLTSLRTEEEVVVKHFLDSLSGALLFQPHPGEKVLDLGAGAGFPSLPLKMVMNRWCLTLLESQQYPCLFLEEMAHLFGLKDTVVRKERAEAWARREGRESYSWVLARAVAPMATLLELALPLLLVGGHFLAWKGGEVTAEIEAAGPALEELGGEIVQIQSITLPYWSLDRKLILVRKVESTPEKYPRRAGIPQKRPLGIGEKIV